MSILKKSKSKEDNEIYKQVYKWIKEGKVNFSFYNSYMPVEILQLYHDKNKGTVEVKIRDIIGDRIHELKELNKNV